jgi:riboflavin synthase
MFTGLIEEVGVVRRLDKSRNGGRLSVQARKVLEGTNLGDSISVSGACLTVVDLATDGFTVDCMPETISLTTLGGARAGRAVNLERSLTFGARLGGHLVLGHVDGVAEVVGIAQKGSSHEVTFTLPEAVACYVAPKGSVAIDGVSLTVMRVGKETFEIGIIPHTLEQTTLKIMRPGMLVNVEADVLARYVQRALQSGSSVGSVVGTEGGLTEELLREKGFV